MLAPNLLICEGDDDLDVILHLLGRHRFKRVSAVEESGSGYILAPQGGELLQLRRAGGYDSLRTNLKLFLHPDLKRLGIIIDADSDVLKRWQSMADLFTRLGYSRVPEQPHENGVVIAEPGLAVLGAWVMPDNLNTGAVEQFLMYLIPTSDSLWPVAREAVAAIPVSHRAFRPQHETKAELRTWLAWQQDPGIPVGLPITRGTLSSHAAIAQRFVGWVKRLLAAKPLPF